eukprot:Hpha_TRINITY_DN16751_c2_g11::TRINITY_DN16751_c2_g11_i1::g.79300::m.79300
MPTLEFAVEGCSVLCRPDLPVDRLARGESWRAGLPCEFALIALELPADSHVDSVQLVNDRASHVQIRGDDATVERTPWRQARPLSPKIQLRSLFEHKGELNPGSAVTIALEHAELTFRRILVGLYGEFSPRLPVGLQYLVLQGTPAVAGAVPRAPFSATPCHRPTPVSPFGTSTPVRAEEVAATMWPPLTAKAPAPAATGAAPAPAPSAPATFAELHCPASAPAPAPLKASPAPAPAPAVPTRATDLSGTKPPDGGLPLTGSAVCLSGFVHPERGDLRSIALKLGAVCVDEVGKATHVICAYRNTPKHKQAVSKGVPAVGSGWLRDCAAESLKLPVERWLIAPPTGVHSSVSPSPGEPAKRMRS